MIDIDIPFTTYKDIEKSIPIVKEILFKNNINLNKQTLEEMTIKIMTMSYSKGGWYSKEELVAYTEIYIQILSSLMVKKELTQNNIKMDEHDIWFLTGKIIEISHNNGGGASEEEIKRITKQCIDNGLYKEFIGYSKKFYDRIMPVTGNK